MLGLFCAPFFHLYAHDKVGFAGVWLRTAMSPFHGLLPDLDDKTFAILIVSSFMQVVTILQMPAFLGTSFNPFTMISELVSTPFAGISSKTTSTTANMAKRTVAERGNGPSGPSSSEKSEKKKKKRGMAGKSKRA